MKTSEHVYLTRGRLNVGLVSPDHADETQPNCLPKGRRINPLIGRVGMVQVQSGGLTPKQMALKMEVRF